MQAYKRRRRDSRNEISTFVKRCDEKFRNEIVLIKWQNLILQRQCVHSSIIKFNTSQMFPSADQVDDIVKGQCQCHAEVQLAIVSLIFFNQLKTWDILMGKAKNIISVLTCYEFLIKTSTFPVRQARCWITSWDSEDSNVVVELK